MSPEASIAQDDVFGALRAATDSQHRAIEALLAFDRIESIDRYRRILQGFDTFLGVWEPAVLAGVGAAIRAWIAPRFRRHWLEQDLQCLPGAPASPLAPAVSDLAAALRGNPAVFGSLYVLEGSALGGQLICRQLAGTLSLTPERGAAYFYGHGTATGAMWKEFKTQFLRVVPSDSSSLAQACHAACATFDALTEQFRLSLREKRDYPLAATSVENQR